MQNSAAAAVTEKMQRLTWFVTLDDLVGRSLCPVTECGTTTVVRKDVNDLDAR